MKIEPFKMEVTPEQSRQVQEILFRNWGEWNSGDAYVQHEEEPFLFFSGKYLQFITKLSRSYFEDGRPEPQITFADFMARYGGAQITTPTQFDTMRKIVTIAEEAHENGETGLCSVLLDALADYISNNRPE